MSAAEVADDILHYFVDEIEPGTEFVGSGLESELRIVVEVAGDLHAARRVLVDRYGDRNFDLIDGDIAESWSNWKPQLEVLFVSASSRHTANGRAAVGSDNPPADGDIQSDAHLRLSHSRGFLVRGAFPVVPGAPMRGPLRLG